MHERNELDELLMRELEGEMSRADVLKRGAAAGAALFGVSALFGAGSALAKTQATRTSRSHFHHAQFTIACTYARLGRKKEAVEWLRQTAENGMPNYPLFRNDPNLESLQGDPDYEALMARLQRQHEEFRRLVANQ